MKKGGKIVEKFFPYIIAIIVCAVLKRIFKECFLEIKLIDVLLESMFSIITTLIGFFITALTIFITFIKSQIIKYLKKNELLNRVLYFFIEPILIGIVIIGIIIFIVANVGENNVINTNYFILGITSVSCFMCSTLRAVIILLIVFITAVNEPNILEN